METDTRDGIDQDLIIDDGDDQHELGIKGQQRIRKMLSQHNPVNVIHEFQDRNGLHFANTDAVLKFLDLLGFSRCNVYSSLNEKLLRHFHEKLKKATPEQIQTLLRSSFRYIRAHGLSQIPIWILSEIETIPRSCLDQLAQHSSLLETLPLNIVRQIWAAYPNIFISKLSDLFNSYINDPNRVMTYQAYYSHVPHAVSDRRSCDTILQELVNWIGTSFPLYEICLRTIRDRFGATNHYGYCVLRMELLMSLHDMGRANIVALDPIHQLTWCLNAASREKSIDGRLMSEFTTQYTQLKEGGDIVPDSGELAPEMIAQLQDLSMVVAHPFITNVLLRSIEANLLRIVRAAEDDQLPKDNEQLRVLTQTLYIGCNVRKLLRARRQFKLPKCPHTVFRKLYPLLGVLTLNCFGVDDVADSLINILLNDKGQIGLCIVMAFTTSYLSNYEYDRASILFSVLGRVDASAISTAPLSPFNRFIATIMTSMTLDARHRSQLTSNAAFRKRFFVSFLFPIAKGFEQVKTQCFDLISSISNAIPICDLAGYLISLDSESNEVHQQLLAEVTGLADAIEMRRSQHSNDELVLINDQQIESRSEIVPEPEEASTSAE